MSDNTDSVSPEEATKKETTLLRAGGGGASEDAFTTSPSDSDANIGVDSKTSVEVDSVENDIPDAVSSKCFHLSTYNPLLALATLVAEESPRPVMNGSSNREDDYQKSLPSTLHSKRMSEKQRQATKPPPSTKTAQMKTKLEKDEAREEPNNEERSLKKANDCRIVEAAWNRNYKGLVVYHAAHGHSNVPRSYPNKQLSGWVKRQRNNLKDGKLSSSQIVLLNNLDFVWNRTDGQWYKKFCSLVRFQQKFGHCYVTAKYDRSLAEWTQRQRREYKTRPTKMPHERLQKLEALDGWSWDKLKHQAVETHYVPKNHET